MCKEKLNVSTKLQWGDSEFTLLGLFFSTELSEMTKTNYEKAIVKAKQCLNSWRYRYLTPIGKITVVKTLILSKFTHLFMSLPSTIQILDEINKLIFNYIWSGKPDKVNRQQICKKNLAGGLGMVNIYNFERSLKMRWLKCIISCQKPEWLTLLRCELEDLNRFTTLGGDWCTLKLQNINQFWKVVFIYFKEFSRDITVQSNKDIFCSSLWYNTHVGTGNIFFPDWFKHGIRIVGDVIDESGVFLTLSELKNLYNFPVNFLNYLTIKHKVQDFIASSKQETAAFDCQRPYIPFHLKTLASMQCGSKPIYLQLQSKNHYPSQNETKWCLTLNMDPSYNLWRLVYKICFYTISDNDCIWFQYRILHRFIGVKDFLKKIKISENNRCRLCNEYTESIVHLFSECAVSNALWNNLISWIEARITIRLSLNKTSKIIGYTQWDNQFWPLNFVLTMTRRYIFTCAKTERDPNIYCLQSIIKSKYYEQEMLAKVNNTFQKFKKNWSVWHTIFSD